jgi:hypothetical protein
MTEELTEQVTPEVNEEATPETKEQVWERTLQTEAPITKEELRGEDREPEEGVLPDRALVAPEIAEYLKTVEEPETGAAISEIASLRARMEELAAPIPEEPTEMQQLLQRFNALEQRDLDREQKASERANQEAEEARFRTFHEGVVGNIRAEEDKYPGLIALSLEGNVSTTLINQLQDGKQVSEYDVASKAETELWELYEVLHALKTKTSEDPEPSKAPKPTNTLTPNLTAVDEPWSLEEAMTKGKRQAQAELWERIHQNQ